MEQFFKDLSKSILSNVKSNEHLMLNFWGENSHFTRFNQSKVRQNGFVSDATLSITLISNQRTCSTSFSLTKNLSNDLSIAIQYLDSLRNDIVFLPEDPFIVLPSDGKSSSNTHKGEIPALDKSVSLLSPVIAGVDLTGIWASGLTFVGHANSKNQSHWFSTESFSFDYSISTPQERMVKDTFAGNVFNQDEYHKFMNNSINHLDILKKDAEQTYANYEVMLNEKFDGSKINENNKGLARELARMNLTLNTYTQWYWKTDLLNLMNFLRLRADQHAQYEIRAYADIMLDTLKKWVPTTYEAFMDYRVGGTEVSAKGKSIIQKLIKGEKVSIEDSGLSKREWNELMIAFELKDKVI